MVIEYAIIKDASCENYGGRELLTLTFHTLSGDEMYEFKLNEFSDITKANALVRYVQADGFDDLNGKGLRVVKDKENGTLLAFGHPYKDRFIATNSKKIYKELTSNVLSHL